MQQVFLSNHPRGLRVFSAFLLSYLLIVVPFAQIAAGARRAADIRRQPADGRQQDSSSNSDTAAENIFAPVPKPAPEPPVAAVITATKDDGVAFATPVAPGGTINYTLTVNNSGTTAGTNVQFTDTIDSHTTLVPGSPIAATSDSYNTIGNVQLTIPDGATDLLGNDFDPDTGNNTGMTVTAETKSSTNCTGGCSNNVTISANGSFTYDPPIGFSGNDTFTYTAISGASSVTATVTIAVANEIWFIKNSGAAGGACSSNCDGRLSHPFPTLAAFNAANLGGAGQPGDNDWIFVFESTTDYTGPATLRLGQKFIGQDATASLITLTGFTQPSGTDPLPVMNATPATIVNISGTNVNGINLNSGNTLRGFTVGNVGTGTKISGTTFGTLIVGNNASPDVTLTGTGRALGLTTGTLSVTGGLVGLSSTNSGTQGISLSAVADSDGAGGSSFNFGSTTISGSTNEGILVTGSTADLNFGNTSVTGGTDGVSLQNNSAGTRTFGTLSISTGSGIGFRHFDPDGGGAAVGGGAVTVTGATTVTNPTGNGIDVQNSNANLSFAATTVNKNATGNIGVNLVNNATRTIAFTSLASTTTTGFALLTNNSGTVNVSGGSLTQSGAGGGAASLTNTALGLTFTSVSSNGGVNGLLFSGGSGSFASGTTNLQNNTGIGLSMASSAVVANFGNTTVNSSAGDGVDLSSNTGNITFADLDITPDSGLRGFDAQNNTGTLTSTSGDIAATGAAAVFIDGPAGRTPLAMVLNNVDSTNSSADGVNLTDVSGNFTVNDPGVATNITNSTGTGITVVNSAAGTINFGNTNVSGSGNGNVDDIGTGVILTNNAGAITFADLDIAPDSTERAFFATDNDGATAAGAITITSGTVSTTNDIAVEISGATSAARTPLNIQFTTINVTGGAVAAMGIVLTNTSTTGAPGGFSVVGTGGTCTFTSNAGCSGGRITNTSGADNNASAGIGVKLTDVNSVSLTRMRIDTHPNFAIRGHGVNGFTLQNVVIDGNNGTNQTADIDIVNGEDSVRIINLTGSALIDSSYIGGGYENNLRIVNDTGTLNRLTVSNCKIGDLDDGGAGRGVDPTNGDDDVNIEARTAGTVMNVTFTGNTLNNARGDVIQTNGFLGTTMDVVFRGNFVSNNHPNKVVAGGGATFQTVGNKTYDISCNQFRDSNGIGLNVFKLRPANGTTGGTMSGTIFNNRVGVTGVQNSGAADGASGINIDSQGNGVHTTLIKNNVVLNHGEAGIRTNVVDANTVAPVAVTLNATVIGNTVAEPDNPNGFASFFAVQGAVPVADANTTLNLRLGSATVAAEKNNLNDGQGFTNDAFLQRAAGAIGTFNLSRAGSAAVTSTQVVIDDNTVQAASVFTDAGITLVAGNPTLPAAISEACTPPATPPVAMFTVPAERRFETARVDGAVQLTPAVTETPKANTAQVETKPLFARATEALIAFASATRAVIIPTAHTSAGRTEVSDVAQQNLNQQTDVRSNHASSSDAGSNEPHAIDKPAVANHTVRMNRAVAPVSGETVSGTIGTLAAGATTTIKFSVTVNNPPNLTLLGPARVENQAQITADGPISVFSDDTDQPGGGADKTRTLIDLFDTTTTLGSNLNPSNFGDQVTFTATVAENPAQATADPTGTVNFIDTSNGNAVVCGNVALAAGSAQCQTSALTAGTHNIRADYSGDGNFDPSQSNIVAQVVIACTSNPIVTSTADNGAGTLRDALATGCTGTTITFNLPGGGPHTITLTTGELPVARNVTVNNNSGESITVSGNNLSRVFNINSGKTAAIIGLTISGGSAANGAGISNDGTLTVVNSTISGNTATSDGAGIQQTATATSLTLINTTISGNNANGFGGGVDVLGGTATIINSTITNNHGDNDNGGGGGAGGIGRQGGTVTLKNTIVAGNFAGSGTTTRNDIEGAVDGTSSNNLIGDGTNMTGITNATQGNQVGSSGTPIDPQLGALASNGGTTQTHALLATSTAVGGGDNTNLPTDAFDLDGDANTGEQLPVDQRGPGFPRVIGANVDIGAFELGQADLSITKTDGVTTEVPGTSVTYTIVVTNNGPNAATGATVADTFPGILTGVTYTSVAAGGATGNTAAGAGNISDTLNMPSGSSVTYTVNATIQSSATGSLVNTATVTAPVSVSDPTPGNNSATDTDTLSPQADLSITKTDGSVTEVPGTSVTYTIVVTNSGPSDAPGTTVSDTFPAALTGVTYTSVAAGGATGNTAAGAGNIGDTVNMPSGSSITYTVNATVGASATGNLVNTATVTAGGGVTDPTPGNNSATDTDTLSPQADLAITKTDGSATEVPGTSVTYTIVVTNNGPSDVTGATVGDTFPAALTGVTYTSVAAGGATGNTAAGAGNIGDTVNMPSGSSITYTVNATVGASATGTLSNTASVTAPAGVTDPTPGNNSATDTDTLTASADVSVTKSDSPDPVAAGSNITYTITVTNNGPSDAQSLSLSDAVPANTTLVSVATAAGWTRTDVVPVGGTGTLTFTRGTQAAGAFSTFTVVVNVTAGTANGTTISNTATVSSATTDPTPGNNSATETTLVSNQPNMNVQDASLPEPPSGTATMLFTVSLSSPAPGTITVHYSTANGGGNPATAGACGGGGDYVAVPDTVLTFTVGQQIKTIPVTICADANAGETDETFLLNLSTASGATLVDAQATGTIKAANTAGALLISELRTSGPGGATDEFVEIYNNSDVPHVVPAGGYGLFKMGATCGDTPVLVGTIPAITIPARGHFLFTGAGYGLADYGGTGAAAGNAPLTSDIESDHNVALFATTNVANISTANRFDAVGFGGNTGGSCDLLLEGTTLPPAAGSTTQHSYFRKLCDFVSGTGCTTPGTPKDTNNNSVDFFLANTTATNIGGSQRLGAPGPENLASPIRRDANMQLFLLDGGVGVSSVPNRVRDMTPGDPLFAANGTLALRRRIFNSTGSTVTRLRFRVVEITTIPLVAGDADVRAMTTPTDVAGVTITNDTVTCGGPASCTVTVKKTTLETPPAQPNGGGWNSTLTVDIPGGMPNNSSVNIQLLLGVQTTGNFRYYIIVEALP